MRRTIWLSVCVVLGIALVGADSSAKPKPRKLPITGFVTSPAEPMTPPEMGASMFQPAAVTTTILGWYQFDTPGGQPTTQGWTTHDMTAQVKSYWHVAGAGCSDAITPINGSKSMWCGQWTTTVDPWRCWASLPGYGNNWDQSLETTVSSVTSVAYKIRWESEPGYDYTYPEWYDPVISEWVADAAANGGAGGYTDAGGPLSESLTSPYGPTKFRFHVVSDWAWCDEDGSWPTEQGAALIDDVSLNGGAVETFEATACNAQTVGSWNATARPGFGQYGALYSAAALAQEDPCAKPSSHVWGWFDNPAVTSYACGGWPLQGAMPYGPDENGMYLDNEIWSPWMPITGSGNRFLLEFLVYRDLPLENLQFYHYHVRTRDIASGDCPINWNPTAEAYYGRDKDWSRISLDCSVWVNRYEGTDLQVAIGVTDESARWNGVLGTGSCHSHAPLIDQVKVMRLSRPGPCMYLSTPWGMFQDTFPENGDITSTSFARCDQGADTNDDSGKRICPGDSVTLSCADPLGLAVDNTGGRPGLAAYLFVKVTDRFGNPVAGKSGLALQSPDNKGWSGDVSTGLLRYPYVAGVAPTGWSAYRFDWSYFAEGVTSREWYFLCCDLMDISAYLPPGWHPNENAPANVGIFAPGDVIHYFFGAKNTAGTWNYLSRLRDGQGAFFQTNNVNDCMASPMEWSVLPDAGRNPGDQGDILFVDGTENATGTARIFWEYFNNIVEDGAPPSQPYFDWAFEYLGIENRVDRFDIQGPATVVNNSLASRVKNIQKQLIGEAPNEGYQMIIWSCGSHSMDLMGDGGTPNGGSSFEKSDDFALCYTFLNNHPNNPGWAYYGDDVVQDWADLTGAGAIAVTNTFMNHTLLGSDQRVVTGQVSPLVSAVPTSPFATETFYMGGGCPIINDFDMPGASGASFVGHKYNNTVPASVYQATANSVGSTARFFLAGFGFDYIRDDDTDNVPDYATHLWKVLQWMQNVIPSPTGIDPVAFSNKLEHAYPNPFNPTTTIRYSIASAGRVSLRIYNAAGQLVRTLVDEEQTPAAERLSATWDGLSDQGQPTASGVYFYKLTTKGFSDTKKMVLLK
jgi:hypothetical protein